MSLFIACPHPSLHLLHLPGLPLAELAGEPQGQNQAFHGGNLAPCSPQGLVGVRVHTCTRKCVRVWCVCMRHPARPQDQKNSHTHAPNPVPLTLIPDFGPQGYRGWNGRLVPNPPGTCTGSPSSRALVPPSTPSPAPKERPETSEPPLKCAAWQRAAGLSAEPLPAAFQMLATRQEVTSGLRQDFFFS